MHRWAIVWCVLAVLPGYAAGSSRSIQPWWTTGQFEGVTEVEQRLFDYTNVERRKRHVPELRPLPALQTAARQHSGEMLDQNYFSHNSPNPAWATPSMRCYRAGLWEGQAGENIVMMWSSDDVSAAQLAWEFMYGDHGWMNSPGHRQNILDPQYTHLGLGVAAGNGHYYATQNFAHPYYELSDLRLTNDGRRAEVRGRARLITSTCRVCVGVDNRLGQGVRVDSGATFPFAATVPVDGALHTVGLHPSRDGSSYWVENLFYIDTGTACQLVMPDD